MARIDGAGKTSVGYVSLFYGGERVEDVELHVQLLGMTLNLQEERFQPVYGAHVISIQDEIFPPITKSLLKTDNG
jgi:hypothetical protein